MKKQRKKPSIAEGVKNLFRFPLQLYTKLDFSSSEFYVHKDIKFSLEQKISNLLVVSKLLGYELKYESFPLYGKLGKIIDSYFVIYRFHRPYDINEGVHIEFKFDKVKSLIRIDVYHIRQNENIFTALDKYPVKKEALQCLDKALEFLK